MTNLSPFMEISVVAGTAKKEGDQPVFNMFQMRVRPEYVAATNPVTEGPHPDVKSIVYFSAESGLKPVLSSMTADEVDHWVTELG